MSSDREISFARKNKIEGGYQMGAESSNIMKSFLLQKGLMIKEDAKLRTHIKDILNELNINDPIEACFVGAVDAMIYDMAFATAKRKWADHKKRKEIIFELWKKE